MIRVVKVGGSLLDLPQLPQKLRMWLAAQSPAHNVLVVGGGPLVEQVRTWHAETGIDESMALMSDRRIRHAPVVENGARVGMISIGDLVKFKSKRQSFQIQYLTDYIEAR